MPPSSLRAVNTPGIKSVAMPSASARDARDSEREHGALRAAEDAVELDTTGFTLEEVVGRVIALARERSLVGAAS